MIILQDTGEIPHPIKTHVESRHHCCTVLDVVARTRKRVPILLPLLPWKSCLQQLMIEKDKTLSWDLVDGCEEDLDTYKRMFTQMQVYSTLEVNLSCTWQKLYNCFSPQALPLEGWIWPSMFCWTDWGECTPFPQTFPAKP